MFSWLFSDPLPAGAKAPDFVLPDELGHMVALSALRGRNVALVFYPGDDTFVCTRQLCSYTAGLEGFAGVGATVWGISPQDVDSHEKFARKRELAERNQGGS